MPYIEIGKDMLIYREEETIRRYSRELTFIEEQKSRILAIIEKSKKEIELLNSKPDNYTVEEWED